MKSPTVGITGCAGQVGSTILRHLHDGGWKVVAAVRNPLSAALCDAAVPNCEIRVGSLTASGEGHLLDDCEAIINCAIESSGGIPSDVHAQSLARRRSVASKVAALARSPEHRRCLRRADPGISRR